MKRIAGIGKKLHVGQSVLENSDCVQIWVKNNPKKHVEFPAHFDQPKVASVWQWTRRRVKRCIIICWPPEVTNYVLSMQNSCANNGGRKFVQVVRPRKTTFVTMALCEIISTNQNASFHSVALGGCERPDAKRVVFCWVHSFWQLQLSWCLQLDWSVLT